MKTKIQKTKLRIILNKRENQTQQQNVKLNIQNQIKKNNIA